MSKFKILAFLKNPLALLYIFPNQTLNANFNYFLKGRLQFKQALRSKFLVTAKGWFWQTLQEIGCQPVNLKYCMKRVFILDYVI